MRTSLADRQRRGEAQLVEAVVDGHRVAAEREHLVEQRRRERERQVPVRDRPAERRLGRPDRIGVDPLAVAGDLGEGVDRLLVDRDVVADPELGPGAPCQFVDWRRW